MTLEYTLLFEAPNNPLPHPDSLTGSLQIPQPFVGQSWWLCCVEDGLIAEGQDVSSANMAFTAVFISAASHVDVI